MMAGPYCILLRLCASSWTRITIPLPNAALTESTRFRWRQATAGLNNMWAIDNSKQPITFHVEMLLNQNKTFVFNVCLLKWQSIRRLHSTSLLDRPSQTSIRNSSRHLEVFPLCEVVEESLLYVDTPSFPLDFDRVYFICTHVALYPTNQHRDVKQITLNCSVWYIHYFVNVYL